MSQELVKKWLKKDDKAIEKDKERSEQEKKELITAIEQMLVNSFERSIDEGLVALAKLHHDLFSSAVSGSEKGSTALFHLRNNLDKLIFQHYDVDIGIFLINYSRNWFRLFIILESRAQEYISWIANIQESHTNYHQVLRELNNKLNIKNSIYDENHKFYKSVDLELEAIGEQVSVEAANRLRNIIQNSMRLSLTDNEYIEKLQLIAFLITKNVSHAITKQELIHELAKDWFRKSLVFKKWFHEFMDQLTPDLEYKMYKGYNWMKLEGKPLKSIVQHKKLNDKKET